MSFWALARAWAEGSASISREELIIRREGESSLVGTRPTRERVMGLIDEGHVGLAE